MFADSQKTAEFINSLGDNFVTYYITEEGALEREPMDADPKVISQYVSFDNSLFDKKSKSLIVDITLTEKSFFQTINIKAETEIYPRNF